MDSSCSCTFTDWWWFSVARPMIGDARRDVVVTMRITKEEQDFLVTHFGGPKPANGLRVLLDRAKESAVAKA